MTLKRERVLIACILCVTAATEVFAAGFDDRAGWLVLTLAACVQLACSIRMIRQPASAA